MKLTEAQWTVLLHTKDGHVFRSEGARDLYACYDRAQRPQGGIGYKRVTAIVERLSALGLVQIGAHVPATHGRPWLITEQGLQALAQKAAS